MAHSIPKNNKSSYPQAHHSMHPVLQSPSANLAESRTTLNFSQAQSTSNPNIVNHQLSGNPGLYSGFPGNLPPTSAPKNMHSSINPASIQQPITKFAQNNHLHGTFHPSSYASAMPIPSSMYNSTNTSVSYRSNFTDTNPQMNTMGNRHLAQAPSNLPPSLRTTSHTLQYMQSNPQMNQQQLQNKNTPLSAKFR